MNKDKRHHLLDVMDVCGAPYIPSATLIIKINWINLFSQKQVEAVTTLWNNVVELVVWLIIDFWTNQLQIEYRIILTGYLSSEHFFFENIDP